MSKIYNLTSGKEHSEVDLIEFTNAIALENGDNNSINSVVEALAYLTTECDSFVVKDLT